MSLALRKRALHELMRSPGATTSGLTRPSAVGPRDENDDTPYRLGRSALTEPTAMQSSRLAGSPIDIAELISVSPSGVVTCSRPSLPQATTTSTPARHCRRSSAQIGEKPQPYTVLSNGPPRLRFRPWIASPSV